MNNSILPNESFFLEDPYQSARLLSDLGILDVVLPQPMTMSTERHEKVFTINDNPTHWLLILVETWPGGRLWVRGWPKQRYPTDDVVQKAIRGTFEDVPPGEITSRQHVVIRPEILGRN